MTSDLDALTQQLLALKEQGGRVPPLDQWQPELSGDMDMRIDKDGGWWHEGTLIKREKLAQLFSSILRKENDDYFLVTPVEKWRIQVDDLPLRIISGHINCDGDAPVWVFYSNMGDVVPLSQEHKVHVDYDSVSQEPMPSLYIRHGLSARIARTLYYSLVDEADIKTSGEESVLCLHSAGESFEIGRFVGD